MSRSSAFHFSRGILLAAFMVGCSKPPVNWDSAFAPLTILSSSSSPSVGVSTTYSIQGGVPPFSVSLSGLGTLQVQNTRTILYQRPWQTGSAAISVTDLLGKTVTLPLTLSAGAIQLGGGADPLTTPILYGKDSSFNLYVLGSTQASMDGSLYGIGGALNGSAGNQMLYLSKIDSSGTVKWISQLAAGSFSTTTALQLSVDNTGNSYVLGTTNGQLPGTAFTPGVLDAFVAKFDTSGNLVWVNQLSAGAGTSTNPVQLILGAGGVTYVGGSVTGSFVAAGIAGAVQSGAHGAQDAFLAKISSAGVVSWINQIGGGGAGTTTFVQMVQDAGPNTYLAGTSDGSLGGTQTGTHGSLDAFVAKMSSAGVLSWVDQLGEGGGTTTTVTAAAWDPIAGAPDIFGMTTGTDAAVTVLGIGHGSQDSVVAQFNPGTGLKSWANQLGGGGAANILSATGGVDSAGNAYLVGTTDTDLTTTGVLYQPQIGAHGTVDAILLKLSSAGALTWLRQAGGGNVMTPSALLNFTGGNIFVAGALNPVAPFLGGTLVGTRGVQDAYVLSLSAAGALNWSAEVGGSGVSMTGATQFALDGSGNMYLTGQTSGLLGGTQYGTHGNRDVYLVKTSSLGALTWVSQLGAGGSSQTLPVQFVQDASLNTFIVGQATRNLMGPLVGPSNFFDSFLIKVNSSGQMQ